MGMWTEARIAGERKFHEEWKTLKWERVWVWWPVYLGRMRPRQFRKSYPAPRRFCCWLEYADTTYGGWYRDCAKAPDVI